MFSSLAPYIAKDYFLWKEIKRQAELGYIKASICTNWQLVKPRALHSTQLATAGRSLAPHQGGTGHRPSAQKPEPRSHPRAAFSAARNWSRLTYSSLQPFPKNVLPLTWGTVTDRGSASNPHGRKGRNASAHTATASEYDMGTSSQLRHGHYQEFRQTPSVYDSTYPKKHSSKCFLFGFISFRYKTSHTYSKSLKALVNVNTNFWGFRTDLWQILNKARWHHRRKQDGWLQNGTTTELKEAEKHCTVSLQKDSRTAKPIKRVYRQTAGWAKRK